MSHDQKRVYTSPARSAQAAHTRQRVLAAAKALFQREGFEGATIEKLARAADVSSATVYALFQSKIGILRALMEDALPPETHTALVEGGKKETTPEGRLRTAARIARQMYDAERATMDIFQGAAVLAPEFRELEKEREARRYTRLQEAITTLAADYPLAPGLTLSTAHDVFWALTGRDLYRMLVVERGWSSDAFETWLTRQLVVTLLAPTP